MSQSARGYRLRSYLAYLWRGVSHLRMRLADAVHTSARWRRGLFFLKIICVGGVLGCLGVILTNRYIVGSTSGRIQTIAQVQMSPQLTGNLRVGIVLGAAIWSDGMPSPIYADRLQTAIALYDADLIDRILVSGADDGIRRDELRPARAYLIRHGVTSGHIVLDYAGFDTYDSMWRAHEIFGVQEAYLVTQRYHLHRAIYLGRSLGIDAYGVSADLHLYAAMSRYRRRERLARIKAAGEIILGSSPRYGGEKVEVR